MDSPLLVTAVIFVAVLLLVEGTFYLVDDAKAGRAKDAINRRLRLLAAGGTGEEVLAKLRRQELPQDGLLAAIASFSVVRWLEGLLTRAGLTLPLQRLLMGSAAGFVFLSLALYQVAALALYQSVVLALVLAVGGPILLIVRMARSRRNKFAAQLADAVEMIARSLRAGHPIPTAINLVSREMPDPIGTEFGIVFDEMTYGLDLREALDNLSARIDLPDLHYMVLAVRIQYGTGGNLADVLGGLGKLIRERFRLFAKIKALSAEGRVSAIILSALPFVVVGMVMLFSPDYYRSVANHPTFHKYVVVGMGLITTGLFIMQRLVNFRV
ncbi:MAG: type II secretion system F family protein [Solirubrobacterales bacterium]